MMKKTLITLLTKNEAATVNAKNNTVNSKIPASCHAKSLMKKEMKKPKTIANPKTAAPKMKVPYLELSPPQSGSLS